MFVNFRSTTADFNNLMWVYAAYFTLVRLYGQGPAPVDLLFYMQSVLT